MTPSDFQRLRARFRGALLQPGEEGYDQARRVWNGAIDRRPRLIARCVGADDVREAVRFARSHSLPVSVRAGGHAVAGHAVCDDGLMIDLSLMKTLEVNPQAGRVRVSGGVLLGELDRATQPFGLAVPAGIVSHTGVAGLTLGGGLGHLMRKHGLTVDSLRSVELVSADGESLHVDAEREPELFWGLRGGGGNFGIATSFEFQLHPVGPMLLGGPIFWPIADAPRVLRYLRELAPEAPDELSIALTLRNAPPLPFLSPEHHGKPVVGLVPVWAGDPAAGAKFLEPLRSLATPLVDMIRLAPFTWIQSLLDAGNPHGAHYYWRSQRIARLSDEVIEILIERALGIAAPLSYVAGFAMGGAACRVPEEATAVGRRAPGFEVNLVSAWSPRDPRAAEHVAWARAGWDHLSPHRSGVYANFLSDEGDAGVESAYAERLTRLRALKRRVDPTNFFRLNANIRPAE